MGSVFTEIDKKANNTDLIKIHRRRSIEANKCANCNLELGKKDTEDNEYKIYQVIEVESMEKMLEGLQDPEIAKLRTDAGVNLDSQEVVFLVE